MRTFPFFAGLDEQTYAELLAAGHTRHLEKGEPLFFEGEQCKGLFLLQAGSVKIFKLNDQGREQIIHIQKPGDAIAELPLFDGAPYPASACAMEESTVLFIPRANFEALVAARPQLCQAIIRALAQRLRKMVGLVEDLSLRQVRQRLARLLLEEAHGREAFVLTSTNEELAARLGSVRDVISRTMSGLQNDGYIQLTGRHVKIVDREGMAEVAG